MKMKRTWVLVLLAFPVGVVPTATRADEPAPNEDNLLATPTAKLSYALGMDIGLSLKQLGQEVDLKAFAQAVGDVIQGSPPRLTAQQSDQIKKEAFAKIQARQLQQRAQQGEKNQTEGQAFLAKNKDQDGVVTTASGLQYTVLEEGQGDQPKAGDRVTVHYRGTLLDGTEFDSSYQRNQPATFPLTGVITGWTEALQLMGVGSHYKLFVPADLAYGKQGAGSQIGPNATLIFDVKLLAIEK